MELETELNEVVNLLESKLPANPHSRENAALEGNPQRDIKRYFRMLDDALPWNRLEEYYYKQARE